MSRLPQNFIYSTLRIPTTTLNNSCRFCHHHLKVSSFVSTSLSFALNNKMVTNRIDLTTRFFSTFVPRFFTSSSSSFEKDRFGSSSERKNIGYTSDDSPSSSMRKRILDGKRNIQVQDRSKLPYLDRMKRSRGGSLPITTTSIREGGSGTFRGRLNSRNRDERKERNLQDRSRIKKNTSSSAVFSGKPNEAKRKFLPPRQEQPRRPQQRFNKSSTTQNKSHYNQSRDLKDEEDDHEEDQQPRRKTPPEWYQHRQSMKASFPEGWSPPKRISREAMSLIRSMHSTDSETYSLKVLSSHFKLSPEAVRRILKSRFELSREEMERREKRRKERKLKEREEELSNLRLKLKKEQDDVGADGMKDASIGDGEGKVKIDEDSSVKNWRGDMVGERIEMKEMREKVLLEKQQSQQMEQPRPKRGQGGNGRRSQPPSSTRSFESRSRGGYSGRSR